MSTWKKGENEVKYGEHQAINAPPTLPLPSMHGCLINKGKESRRRRKKKDNTVIPRITRSPDYKCFTQ
jgi:hypothetical protein